MKKYTTKEVQKLELEVANRLELDVKNIKFFEGHDTMTGINADLYYKGKKIAHGYDDARRGGMDIRPIDYELETLSAFKDVERLLKAEPEYIHVYDIARSGIPVGGKAPEYKSSHDMEAMINAIANHKQELKEHKKGVIYLEDGEEMLSYWKKTTPEKMVKTPKGLATVQKKVNDLVGNKHTIINAEYLSSIGIRV